MDKHKLDDVYGLARRRLPLTYFSRPQVDERFVNELGRDNHIVVYGSSKQGKSSLLLNTLQESDYVVVQCTIDWSKEKLYGNILREAGVTIVEATQKSKGKGSEINAEAEGEVGNSIIAKFRSRIGAKLNDSSQQSWTEKTIPIDLRSASDVISLLAEIEFDKFVVVEDFHYLSAEVQRELASDLKSFYERSSISFVIVGVWLEANRLIVYNGDLAHRITSIPADTWTNPELSAVVRLGQRFMNATFDETVVEALVSRAQLNVGQLQEAARQMFLARGISATPDDPVQFDDVNEVSVAYEYVAEQLAGRYANAIGKFSEGLRDKTLHMYKWIMHAVISASPEERRAGMKAMDVVRHVQEFHPSGTGVYPNNIISALKNVSKVQHHAEMTPPIFDFDLTHQRLTIVDNGFHVYLEGTEKEIALSYLASFPNEAR